MWGKPDPCGTGEPGKGDEGFGILFSHENESYVFDPKQQKKGGHNLIDYKVNQDFQRKTLESEMPGSFRKF